MMYLQLIRFQAHQPNTDTQKRHLFILRDSSPKLKGKIVGY